MKAARLDGLGLISVTGRDARAFLHAQLTVDLERLPAHRAIYGGWCSAKGRLLASCLVVPHGDGYLLQVSRDLAEPVGKRLRMFVLRSKVAVEDASGAWTQIGLWSPDPAATPLEVQSSEDRISVRIDAERVLRILRQPERADADAETWTLAEIRAGRPLVTLATQDLFVPQMVNLDRIAAVDFDKGCYPGQEVVARARYRGQVKRHMYRVRSPAPLRAGQELFSDDQPSQASGTVVNAAGGEALVVLPVAAVEQRTPVRIAPGGGPLEILPLPYQP